MLWRHSGLKIFSRCKKTYVSGKNISKCQQMLSFFSFSVKVKIIVLKLLFPPWIITIAISYMQDTLVHIEEVLNIEFSSFLLVFSIHVKSVVFIISVTFKTGIASCQLCCLVLSALVSKTLRIYSYSQKPRFKSDCQLVMQILSGNPHPADVK